MRLTTATASDTDDRVTAAPAVDYEQLMLTGRSLVVALGYDPDDESWRETPRRFADSWREFIEFDPGVVDTAFDGLASDQLVVVSDMRLWSVCQHHLLPFWCDVSIAYVPNGVVLGLSKFARVAHAAAHKPQLQERMSEEIATTIQRLTGSTDVAVIARGQHLCMAMRGVRTPGSVTSVVLRGAFRNKDHVYSEFVQKLRA
jgi:GTP cyclohydrolase I